MGGGRVQRVARLPNLYSLGTTAINNAVVIEKNGVIFDIKTQHV